MKFLYNSNKIMLWNNGWLQNAYKFISPNYRARVKEVSLVVIHNISLPPFEYGNNLIKDLFLNNLTDNNNYFINSIKDLKVSSHFVIERTGEIFQFVSCDNVAFHAGVSSFMGRDNCNDFSIGIELEGCDFENFTNEQYISLLSLLKSIYKQYNIKYICGHSDIAPQRKTDPGNFFHWELLVKNNFKIYNISKEVKI